MCEAGVRIVTCEEVVAIIRERSTLDEAIYSAADTDGARAAVNRLALSPAHGVRYDRSPHHYHAASSGARTAPQGSRSCATSSVAQDAARPSSSNRVRTSTHWENLMPFVFAERGRGSRPSSHASSRRLAAAQSTTRSESMTEHKPPPQATERHNVYRQPSYSMNAVV